jgi:hypothetical protein
VVLRHRGREIVADTRLVVEELAGHDRADRVAAVVSCIGIARSVAEEPGKRINSTRIKL